ncbi:MAG: flagellin B [Deltaproteobacteria bacterium]|nr:flagellin B [Candidatus Anaeroferrophillus wilburensis]MBN2888356.1 flagellin B [Deltaproteobacteria bacterium]
MALKINTNIAALNAHRNMIKTDSALSQSLERLSSGLRINKAADDASGMQIADSLKAQAMGLGQAVTNANDGIAVVQVADGALEESINIVNTIRTKALQAASDGQSTDSRAAIQRDVSKLLEAMNNIANNTAFNGQTLLKGDFQNKFFQVGAYANQTVSVSIANADASHVGRLATTNSGTMGTSVVTADLVADATPATGEWASTVGAGVTLNGVNLGGYLSAQGTSQLSAKGLAAAINAVSSTTGVDATVVTEWTGTGAVAAGTVADGGIIINGVSIGAISVSTNDASGTLEAAINAQTGSTGVSASTDASGLLTLTAEDGRNIAVSGASVAVLGAGFAANTTNVVFTAGSAADDGAVNFNLDGVNISYSAAGLAAADGVALAAALTAAQTAGTISSNYTITDNSDGTVTVERTDGLDINVLNDTDNVAAFEIDGVAGNATSGLIKNSSQKGVVTLTSDQTVTIGGDTSTLASFGLSATSVSATGGIADADVTSFTAAQITIQRADSALTALGTIRSQLGSAQNQLDSTVRNISVTQVNITAAESTIRDVDFAAESATFAKFQVLSQSGSFAMAQANATLQNVLRLLQ